MLLINDKPVDFFIFPGGELQVTLDELETERVILTWKPENCQDIIQLALVVNSLHQMGIADIDIDCLYLPYARQDRACLPGQAFSVKMMVDLLASLNQPNKTISYRFWDLHSPIVHDLVWNRLSSIIVYPYDIFNRFKILEKIDHNGLVLCAPDLGAYQRVEEIKENVCDYPSFSCRKMRDPNSGKITEIKYSWDVENSNILIVDDICDGGSTFIELAKKLKDEGAADLYLYVTHGIFSKGLGELEEYFKHVYCHHTLSNHFYSSETLTILREFHHV